MVERKHVIGTPRRPLAALLSRPWRVAGISLVASWAVVVAVLATHGLTEPSAPHTYTTRVGERATLSLGDDVSAILAPGSTLQMTRSGARRVALLNGEARFTVARAGDVPFIVRTGRVEARVLGTTFGVRSYPGDSRVLVDVERGKVSVTAQRDERVSGKTVTLVAGDVAVANDSTVKRVSANDLSVYPRWAGDVILCRDTPVQEVLNTLTRWYGSQFRIADSALTRERITADLSTQSLTEALRTLGMVLDASLSSDGKVITLHARRSTRRTFPMSPKRNSPLFPSSSEVGR